MIDARSDVARREPSSSRPPRDVGGFGPPGGGAAAAKKEAGAGAAMTRAEVRTAIGDEYSDVTVSSLATVDPSMVNYALIATLVEYLISTTDADGAILIFLPGLMEITKLLERFTASSGPLSDPERCRIYPLHSTLSSAEQTAIFELPPRGVRKVVVGTNIAETSITIEDVVYVIDAGRVKENRYDADARMATLEEAWVSRASARQRRGRAGRVRAGVAYHLMPSYLHDRELAEYTSPEMLRTSLDELVLQILLLDLGEPAAFLPDWAA